MKREHSYIEPGGSSGNLCGRLVSSGHDASASAPRHVGRAVIVVGDMAARRVVGHLPLRPISVAVSKALSLLAALVVGVGNLEPDWAALELKAIEALDSVVGISGRLEDSKTDALRLALRILEQVDVGDSQAVLGEETS